MNGLSTSSKIRWAVPGLVAAAVAAAAITTTNSAGASDQPNLPTKSAAQLLAAVEQAHPQGLSGTIVETTRLGLPSLPQNDIAGGSLSLQSFLTGSHTMRIWYHGPSRQRIALLAPMAERDVIHNGRDLWTYTSTTNEVTHSIVSGHHETSAPPSTPSQLTPQQAATQALKAIGPSTRVTVDRTARVAGRAAYQLDLWPRDSRSLVGSVRIAIDATTWIPLQVQVFAHGSSTPALQVGFTDISFSAPSQSVFEFKPPAGAQVTQQSALGLGPSGAQPSRAKRGQMHGDAHGQPQILGDGWTSVIVYPSSGIMNGSNAQLVRSMSKPVAGGRLISTSLVSVLITNDGRVLVGPVSGASLQQVAATGRGL